MLYRDMIESKLLKDYFVSIGIPPDDLIIETRSDNTYENALNVSEILQRDYPQSPYLLITSAIHMRRASACFTGSAIEVDLYPTNKLVGERLFHFSHLFIPDTDSLAKWNLLIHEVFGFLVYKIMGYA